MVAPSRVDYNRVNINIRSTRLVALIDSTFQHGRMLFVFGTDKSCFVVGLIMDWIDHINCKLNWIYNGTQSVTATMHVTYKQLSGESETTRR